MSVRIVNSGRVALAVKIRKGATVDFVQMQGGSKVDLPQGFEPDHNFMVNNPAINIVAPMPAVNIPAEKDNNESAES